MKEFDCYLTSSLFNGTNYDLNILTNKHNSIQDSIIPNLTKNELLILAKYILETFKNNETKTTKS